MLANALTESFVLKDIKLGNQERNRQITKLKTSPIYGMHAQFSVQAKSAVHLTSSTNV
jgi:hypothetical protein